MVYNTPMNDALGNPIELNASYLVIDQDGMYQTTILGKAISRQRGYVSLQVEKMLAFKNGLRAPEFDMNGGEGILAFEASRLVKTS